MTINRSISQISRLTSAGLTDYRLWVAVMIGSALTWGFASSGADAWVNDLARQQISTFSLVWSAFPMLVGMVAPAILPLALALWGKRREAVLTVSAFLVALIIVSVLKGITSRVHPEALEPATSLLRSQAFRIGFLEDGLSSIIEGWPSGHTATNGAAALTLWRISSASGVRALSLGWFAWVALATVFGISGDVHWLSDTIAGGLIAWAISMRLTAVQLGKT